MSQYNSHVAFGCVLVLMQWLRCHPLHRDTPLPIINQTNKPTAHSYSLQSRIIKHFAPLWDKVACWRSTSMGADR